MAHIKKTTILDGGIPVPEPAPAPADEEPKNALKKLGGKPETLPLDEEPKKK